MWAVYTAHYIKRGGDNMKFLRMFGYMNDNVYKYIVWIVTVGMPAFGTFYYMLADTWGFNHVTQVLGTISALETFLGVCLGISSTNYKEEHK